MQATQHKRVVLSTLWLFATLNYLYCDVVTLMDPSLLKQFLAGNIGGIEVSQAFLLAAGALVEIPIAMVFLALMTFRALAGGFNARQHDGITAAAIFWYATVAVYFLIWISIYVTK